ncbi:MAG: response regulator [Chloroflexota bacterium]
MGKILIVDDAAFMRLRCSRILEEAGHMALEAENGYEAVKAYQDSRPDGVLMDITMPVMDGLAALKEIKRIDPVARVAMVTALGQQSAVMEALRAGAVDFVVKPFDKDRMLAAVERILSTD